MGFDVVIEGVVLRSLIFEDLGSFFIDVEDLVEEEEHLQVLEDIVCKTRDKSKLFSICL